MQYANNATDPKELIQKEEEASEASRLFDELLFANGVDNFNAYLSDIIMEILAIDPRPIFGRKIDAKTIFSSPDLDSVKSEAIDRMILDMGYQNISDLAEFMEGNFGIRALSHWLTKKRLNRLIQIRNIIAHNRGIVNRTYLHKSGSKSDKLGERVNARFPLLTTSYLDNLAEKIDREAVSKFKLWK